MGDGEVPGGRADGGPGAEAGGPAPRVRTGTVVAFEERRGLGEVEASGSGERFPFHCTRIAGGARRVAVGAAVVFEVGPGRRGRWEARTVRELGPSRPGRGPGGGGR